MSLELYILLKVLFIEQYEGKETQNKALLHIPHWNHVSIQSSFYHVFDLVPPNFCLIWFMEFEQFVDSNFPDFFFH